jgi:hypothetical protein
LNLGNNEGNINYNCVTNNSTIINNANPDPQLEIIGNVISENSSLTNGVGNLFNKFKNNNLQNKAVVILDPLGDPFPLLGEISENDFSNCQILLGVFLVTDILSGNVFNGFVGQVFNFRGFFKNNSFLSSPNYVYNLNNSSPSTPANFNENQLNFCNADIITASNFNENFAEHSSINIQANTNVIRNNTIRHNSTFDIFQNFGSVISNNIEESIFNFGDINVGVFIRYNELRDNSRLIVGTCNNNISSNAFRSYIFNVSINNSSFGSNQLYNGGVGVNTFSSPNFRNIVGNLNIFSLGTFAFSVGSGIIKTGIVTTRVFLNVSDPTIYDLATQTLTIPSELDGVCGIINLTTGSAPITISKILGGLGNLFSAMQFINTTGFNVDFTATPIGLAVPSDIISNLAPNTYTIVDRLDGADSIFIRNLGNLNGVEQVYIYV